MRVDSTVTLHRMRFVQISSHASLIHSALIFIVIIAVVGVKSAPRIVDDNAAVAASRENHVEKAVTVVDQRLRPQPPLSPPRAATRYISNAQRIALPADAPRLQYTITKAEAATPTAILAQNDRPTNDADETSQSDSSKLGHILQTIQQSGILDSFMQMLTPRRHPQQQQQQIEQREIVALATTSDNDKRLSRQNDEPMNLFKLAPSIDARPQFVHSAALGDKADAAIDWKHTLLGPSGIITELFNAINEKRKEEKRQQATATTAVLLVTPSAQADPAGELPAAAGPLGADFTKILDAFMSKTQNGNFDEPLPEIPFLGICDRLSCADIYKAFDEFRKSELFSNFQTAISLLHDQKGWDIIGEMLANPELIGNFVGGSDGGGGGGASSGGIPASASNGSKKLALKAAASAKDGGGSVGVLKSTDGDLGVDFSELVDERPSAISSSSTRGENALPDGGDSLPEIAESVDYYSSVDKGAVEESIARIRKPQTPQTQAQTTSYAPRLTTTRSRLKSSDELEATEKWLEMNRRLTLGQRGAEESVSATNGDGVFRVGEASASTMMRGGNNGGGGKKDAATKRTSTVDIEMLPEIAASIDELPNAEAEEEHLSAQVEERIGKVDEMLKIGSRTSEQSSKRGTRVEIATAAPELFTTATVLYRVAKTFGKNGSQLIESFTQNRPTANPIRYTVARRLPETHSSTRTPSLTLSSPKSSPEPRRSTKQNFRKSNDYYAMYYDNL